ncbi:NAD(P)/FAD-dependent oxidoreductase [Roseospirillum parvum]|uniref:Ferredoxin--NADP reductase n=1 Tax=Roseospirillum parvum TaxID=83401 RepID=A0A1G7ZG22_9PROT|nr:NAD(P)/FAD-dependent oxidoreductase [Roseospirillum parvum]SDH07691.1 thioredoxin reductase (NADPH) [Roseospirillum parvum]
MSQPQTTDVVVVGAGPVGLFTVFQCGMVGLSCHVVDALDTVGGQCAALYPEKPIFDVPGHPRILAGELVDKLVEQAAPFTPTLHLGQTASGLTRLDDAFDGAGGWRLETSAGTVIEAPVVVLAAGAGAFGPNRPPLDGIESFERQGPGVGVHYYVTRQEDFRGRKVVIAGGGDSAVDWALALAEVAASVAVVHRRDRFRAAPDSARRLKEKAAEGAIDLVIPYQLAGLEGTNGHLDAVVVADLDGNQRTLPADTLLPFFGLAGDLGPITQWGVDLHLHHIPVTPGTSATNLPGVFAVGDVCTYPGKLKLILTGFAEAAHAAHAAFPLARPGQALHMEHSTTSGVPGR